MSRTRLEIIHEDENIVVINKPAGLLSIPDRYTPDKPNAWHAASQLLAIELWVVHRLDKDTSGILCFAKNENAHQQLNEQFQNRTVKKEYLALVNGSMVNEKPIEVSLGIKEHPNKLGTMITVQKGKPSYTTFEVLERFRHYTLLKATPLSGRTHQIRVHLQAIGHPLMVDPIYSNVDAFYLSSLKGRKYSQKKGEEEKPLISRLTLHAERLTLKHPENDTEISFHAPPPKDLKAVINQLRKWDAL
jgi:23S rRNA pseudouridine1911/1915/1917 synthase